MLKEADSRESSESFANELTRIARALSQAVSEHGDDGDDEACFTEANVRATLELARAIARVRKHSGAGGQNVLIVLNLVA